MRISLRTLGLLFALLVLVGTITLLVSRLIPSRSEGLGEPTRPLVEPVIQEISAELAWQNTGILLDAYETVHIQFMSGEIHDGETVIRGPAGTGYVCGNSTCCEPVPAAQRDALIGRVGDHLFLIGDKNTIEVRQLSTGGLVTKNGSDGFVNNSTRLGAERQL